MSRKTKQIGYTSDICKHISRVMGDDKRSRNIIHEIQRWVQHSGTRWTIDRLSSLKMGVIDFIRNQRPQVERKFKIVQEKNWIKCDKDGWPKGQLGRYIKSQLIGNNRKMIDFELRRILSILQVSRVFRASEILPFQKEKYIEAITGKPGRDDLFEFSYKLGQEAACSVSSVTKGIYENIFFNSQLRAHNKFNFAGLNSSKTLTTFLPKDLRDKDNGWILSLLECTVLDYPFNKILKQMGVPIKETIKPKPICAGVIKVIQEGGLKARVVAMPCAGAQIAFKPLHNSIGEILKSIPEDCTFNQMKGIEWGSEQLKLGKRMYAVDLSSATDNFPLGFQKAVLDSLNYEFSEEFVETCQMNWGYKDNAFSKMVKYTKGQPMGLYGSFVLFSLSHHYLLQSLQAELGLNDTYRILGDDIIINNDLMYNEYISAMENMYVPISHHKCLISDYYTEFAGKLISPLGKIPVAKGPKGLLAYGAVDTNQFLNYCEVSGSVENVLPAVPKNYRNYARALAQLPQYFGGLGLNPENLSWLDRVARFQSTLKQSLPKKNPSLIRSLCKIKLMTTDDHCELLMNFISEQLDEVSEEIRGKLKGTVFAAINDYTDLERLLLMQALEAQGLDSSLSYVGTISSNTLKRKMNPNTSWKHRMDATGRGVNKQFDQLSQSTPDLTNVDSETLMKSHYHYESWSVGL